MKLTEEFVCSSSGLVEIDDTKSMSNESPIRLVKLTFLVLELNAALDTGKYDHITLPQAKQHIEAGDLFGWLQSTVVEMDLSLFTPDQFKQINDDLRDILGGYGGAERRKWGVENKGLCLLLAWINEIIQQGKFDNSPLR